jgi:lipase chaperone LimK
VTQRRIIVKKKEYESSRKAARERTEARLREFGYTPEALPPVLSASALKALQWALDEVRAWRGSYTGYKEALAEFELNMGKATIALKAVRKQNDAVKALHKHVRSVAEHRMAMFIDMDMARSRKSAGLEK